MGKPILHNYSASVDVVRQIVAKSVGVEEHSIAERHNDLILLKLTQSGNTDTAVEQVNRDHISFGLDFRLQLSRRLRISVHDEHVELAGSWGRRCCRCRSPD